MGEETPGGISYSLCLHERLLRVLPVLIGDVVKDRFKWWNVRACPGLVYMLNALILFLSSLQSIHVFKFLWSFYGKGARVSYTMVI